MNKMFEIIPVEKVGEICFGMSRADVRGILGAPLSEFRKTRRSANTTDDYGNFHVFYDVDDTCEAVELFGGCTACLRGKSCFPKQGLPLLDGCALKTRTAKSRNVTL